MPESEDGFYRLFVSRDVADSPELGGLDNVFATVTFYVEGKSEICLNRFEIENKYEYNDLILRQRSLAQEIGKK